MNDRDIDAEFDAIVAHWDDDAATPPPPRTVQDITAAYAVLSRPETDPGDAVAGSEDEPETDTESGDDARSGQAPADTAGPKPAPQAWPLTAPSAPAGPRPEVTPDASDSAEPEAEAWRQGPSTADEDDHFEPPAVTLPPGEDLGYWGALLGLIGGPLLLLWVVVSQPFYAGWWTLGAILLFFGGFALLVMRDPSDRDPWSDDDGARV
ncbi:hypothetical protein [Knoellia sp. LjRoot47]|uniref:hypothetical protein n=1 Tax=Knoellia sp. LjRoot47 TaxID=3342330 RepID=UPI003ED0176A